MTVHSKVQAITCDSRGRIVVPACPPTTGTSTSFRSKPFASATNVLARTTSNVVTPMSFFLSYTLAAFSTSAAIGTVEFTGLEMMLMIACSHVASQSGAKCNMYKDVQAELMFMRMVAKQGTCTLRSWGLTDMSKQAGRHANLNG